MTHDEITELLGAYALDAVSPEETSEIDQHLAECPRCRAEVAAHREVAGVLGNLGGMVPPGLWSRIADELAIGSEGPLRTSARDGTPLARPTFAEIGSSGADGDKLAGSDGQTRTPPAPAPAPVISIESARPLRSVGPSRTDGSGSSNNRRRRTVLMTSVAAVAAALAVVVGVLSSRVVSLDNRVSALSTGILAGGTKAQVAAAENDPSSITLDLRSTNASWSAKVVALPSGQAFLVPGTMPSIGAGETFQAWAVVNGKYVSLGVLGRAPGDVALQLQPGMSSLLVNTEPQGGSAQPTNPVLISSPLPATL
ncbi:MAG: anti-sigma factor [Acidimicrobiales bacterium]